MLEVSKKNIEGSAYFAAAFIDLPILPLIQGSRYQRYWDPFYELLDGRCLFGDYYSDHELLGWGQEQGPEQYYVTNSPSPYTYTYDWVDDYFDNQRLGLIAGVASLLKALQSGFFKSAGTSIIRGVPEHGCKHTDYHGVVNHHYDPTTSGYDPVYTSGSLTRYGSEPFDQTTWGSKYRKYTRIYVSGGEIVGPETVFGDDSAPIGEMEGLFSQFVKYASYGTSWEFRGYDGLDCKIWYTSFKYTRLAFGAINVNYTRHVRFTSPTSGNTCEVRCDTSWALRKTSSPTMVGDGAVFAASPWCYIYHNEDRETITRDITKYTFESNYSFKRMCSEPTIHSPSVVTKFLQPRIDLILTPPEFPQWNTFEKSRILAKRHASNCASMAVNHFEAAGFLAQTTGLKDYCSILTNNHIETLMELSAIGSLLPDPIPWMNLFKHLKRKNLLGATKSLLDIISNAKLMYSFGIKPTADATIEFAAKFDDVKRRLSGIYGRRTIYGSFFYDLPTEDFGGVSQLEVRTKSMYDFSDNTLLVIALGLQSVGLLPTISNLWDLVPFSFVIDWFTNIGRRMEAVEDQVFLLSLDHIYTVYSYKVTTEFSDELCEYNGITPSGGERPCVTWYDRRPTVFSRRLKSSKYDFLAAKGAPDDLLLVGSLAWSVLT